MHNPPRILIVDDNETNRDILHVRTRDDVFAVSLRSRQDGSTALLPRQACQ